MISGMAWLGLGMIGSAVYRPASADVPTQLEPAYSEAVLKYNEKNYKSSLSGLDRLLKNYPNQVEFLELKALILKTTHEDAGAIQAYKDLIQAKVAARKPVGETAPYQFELGTIFFQQKKYQEAGNNLRSALKGNFNPIPCRFFLGMIEMNQGNWSNAEGYFREVSSAGSGELKTASDFYLGQIYIKLGSPSSATERFYSAQNGAKEQMEDTASSPETRNIAQQIFHGAALALRPLDRNGFFGSINLISGYDTNVLLQGTGETGSSTSTLPSNQSSIKETFMAQLGYSSSPLKPLQFVPVYRNSLNINLNDQTRSGEYFLNNLSVYLTLSALSKTSYGLKVDGNYTLQDQTAAGDPRSFSTFSMSGSFGPYFRYETDSKLVWNFEGNVISQKYLNDENLPTGSTFQRSGTDVNFRASVKNDRGGRYWNPGAFILGDMNLTTGTEFNSKGITFEVNNLFHLSDQFHLLLAADLGLISYNRAPSASRADRAITIDLQGRYTLSSHWSLSAEVQYVANLVSSDDASAIGLYQYNRSVASLSLGYSF